MNASTTAASALNLPRPEDCAALLVEALAPSTRAAARLAQAWGLTHSAQHSPVDLVVQNRRQLAYSDSAADRARLRLIDASIARAWPLAINRRVTDLESAAAAQALQSLAWLSRRFPSPVIHGGLFAAMLQSGTHVDRAADPHVREHIREALSADLLAAWMQTLDRASRAQIEGALTASHLFTPLDKFDAWVWAWRFGIDRAVDFIAAILATNGSDEAPLPLGTAEDREYLATVVAGTSIGSSDAGYRTMVEKLFVMLPLSRATVAWGVWLGSVFAKLPDVGWLMDMPDEAGESAVAGTADLGTGDSDDWASEVDPAVVADERDGPELGTGYSRAAP